MLAILKRMEKDALLGDELLDGGAGGSGDGEGASYTAELDKLDLTEDARWEDLPRSAQQALLKAAAQGQLAGMLEPWLPWLNPKP